MWLKPLLARTLLASGLALAIVVSVAHPEPWTLLIPSKTAWMNSD